jgi:hypothetical protein
MKTRLHIPAPDTPQPRHGSLHEGAKAPGSKPGAFLSGSMSDLTKANFAGDRAEAQPFTITLRSRCMPTITMQARIPTYNRTDQRQRFNFAVLARVSACNDEAAAEILWPRPPTRGDCLMRIVAFFAAISAILTALTPGSFGEDLE